MQTILNLTTMANDVAPQFLQYVGMQNECYTVERIFYLFNIMDPANRRYKSTVTFAKRVLKRNCYASPGQ